MREFEPLKIDPNGRYFIRLTDDNLVEIKGPQKTTKGCIESGNRYQAFAMCLEIGKSKIIRGHVLSYMQWKDSNYIPTKDGSSVIDHKDSNKLNNHPDNLQELDQRGNAMKRTSNMGEYPLGVYLSKGTGKFHSMIRFNGSKRHLGYFYGANEAHVAYMDALSFIRSHSAEEIEKRYPVNHRIKENEGISFNKRSGKWWAAFRGIYLGSFKTREEAVQRRNEYILSLNNHAND